MKLLVQKVARASVEVDGLVESRIGAGLLLTLAVAVGDSVEHAEKMAAKVLKLELFPELTDQEQLWKTNVVDNGYELLVVLQQSLLSAFPALRPEGAPALVAEEAKAICEAFTKRLQAEYQEEMVVAAPFEPRMRIETCGDSPCLFELEAEGTGGKAVKAAAAPKDGPLLDLEPDVAKITKVLRQLPAMAKTKATLESCRVFRTFGMKKFRAALAEALQAEADEFAESLDGAARYFSKRQLEQISTWTGLAISAPSREDFDGKGEDGDGDGAEGAQEDMGEEALQQQLLELKEEVENPAAARKRKLAAIAAKQEEAEEAKVALTRPDWKGRAAPETPAARAAQQWAASRQGRWGQSQAGYAAPSKGAGKTGGKAWGRGGPRPWRSYGIASLDTAARLHHGDAAPAARVYERGQLARYSDHESRFLAAKKEEGGDEEEQALEDEEEQPEQPAKKRAVAAAPRLPKGTPTLAPMTPAPSQAREEL